MQEVLTLSEALNILENGNYHSIAYVSANRNTKEGGKIIRIDECKIIPHTQPHKQQQYVTTATTNIKSKAQNHSLHATRNVSLKNGTVRKAHIYLIFSLNNTPII